MLQDHVYYYLAKSLLMQQKYFLSQQYYSDLMELHPGSIWTEKAALEYADLFFIQQDYSQAETLYQQFLTQHPDSTYVPYGRFQLALCQENNQKLEQAYQNYKQVWLDYPTNEYAETALSFLYNLIEEHGLQPFIATPGQLYQRAEIFFENYNYYSALEQLNLILEQPQLSTQLKAQALFRAGMCYYNLRDYARAEQYLLQCYQSAADHQLADDSLYFLGRAATNLGDNQKAISYYQDLVNRYPQSNFSDDALYRIGRIYFFDDQMEAAIENFNLVLERYPSGDRLSEVLWELGWIHYSSQNYQQAQDIFANMASSFKGSELEEKGLFWQAKCLQKSGQQQQAVDLYQQIVGINSYSCYTFTARDILEQMDIYLYMPPIDNSANPLNPNIEQVVPSVYEVLNDNASAIENPLHIRKALELLKIDLLQSATLEITAGQQEIDDDPVQLLILSTLYHQSQDYTDSISILSRNTSSLRYGLEDSYKDFYYYLLYPYAFRQMVNNYAGQHGIDPCSCWQ
ncbi:MAG: tetratricopeptide repeat protein [Actinomycetota bacterium]|nr:tetratricopeptide repeat protein [Actinomycetota bacterium]